jgi:hypothetical protein
VAVLNQRFDGRGRHPDAVFVILDFFG